MHYNPFLLEQVRDRGGLLGLFLAQRTGSSEITRWLHRFIPEEEFYFFRNISEFVHWRELETRALGGYRAYSGFSDFIPKNIGRPFAAISLLRHPVYRIASLYEMSRRDEKHVYHKLALDGDFEQYYIKGSKDRAYYFQNLCTRRISGRPDFSLAKEMIDEYYGIVANVEDLSKITQILLDDMGWEGEPLPELGDESRRYARYRDLPIAQRIIEENAEDMRLLEEVNLRFFDNLSSKLQKRAVVGDHSPPEAASGDDAGESDVLKIPCPICQTDLAAIRAGDNCPQCRTPARGRSLDTLTRNVIAPYVAQHGLGKKPLLAFAATGAEKGILSEVFSSIESVSLYGDYGGDHTTGVDIRDLSRYEDDTFSGAFGILLFDYFPEHEQALSEIERVLVPNGVLFTLALTTRVLPTSDAPNVTKRIQPRPGYFDYVPEGGELLNVKFGQDWFLAALQRAGLEPSQIRLFDPAGEESLEWFLGFKNAATPRSGNMAEHATPTARQPTAPSISATPPVAAEFVEKDGVFTFTSKVDPAFGFSTVSTALEIPKTPTSVADFAEHNARTGEVVAVNRNGVVVSGDNGLSWTEHRLDNLPGSNLRHCFTTSTGNRLIMADSLKDENDIPNQGRLLCFDNDWKYLSTYTESQSLWHARCCIDERDGTIMWAEYPDNSSKYKDEETARRASLDLGVFRSRDAGVSWEQVLTIPWQEIRHFHTVKADISHPRRWWLSSGDQPHECRVWVSDDDGDTWQEATAPKIDFDLHPSAKSYEQSIHRYTDIWMDEDTLIWGADDWLGPLGEVGNLSVPDDIRVGARMFSSPNTVPLRPKKLGWIGNPVRSITDVGPALLITTEAKRAPLPKPQIYLMSKDDPDLLTELFTLPTGRESGTGFTYSRASATAVDGVFFSFRGSQDLVDGGPRLLKWTVNFE